MMLPDDQGAAPAAAADNAAPAPHVSESIPVQTNIPEPVQVAVDAPADPAAPPASAADPVDGAAAADIEGRQPVQKLPDWAQKKLADTAFEAREAKREAKRLADELEALRNPPAAPVAAPSTADADAARAAAPAGGYKTQAEFDAAVQAEANTRASNAAAEQARADFDRQCNDVWAKGTEAYKDDFAAAVQNLQGVGAMNPDILNMVLATDDPAKVLLDLGSNPDRAAGLLAMPAAKRAVEIAKIAVAVPPKKAADPISKAPPPIRPIEGSARVSPDLKDDDDDATWFAKREAQVRANA